MIGDRIAYVGEEFIGQIGKVIVEKAGPGREIGVEFEVYIGGHCCEGKGKDGHCWWVLPKDVQKVPKTFKRKV